MTALYYSEINLMCIFVLIVLYCTMIKIKRDTSVNLYRGMLLISVAICFCDMIAGVFRGAQFKGAIVVLWLSNIGYFLFAFCLCVNWVIYSVYVLKGVITRRLVAITMSVAGAISIFFLSTPFHGLLFTISRPENLYQRGEFFWIYWVVFLPSMALPSVFVLLSKGKMNDKIAIASFPIMPFCTTLLQTVFYGITVCQVGITGGLLMTYVMIQSKKVQEATTRAEILDEISNTDALTKLRNRRAYEMKIEEYKNKPWVGTIFADLNGLKAENDTKGHKAGDQMICNFASILLEFFERNEIFRISGDEFVVLTDDQEKPYDSFEKMTHKAGDRASSGMSEGSGAEVVQVINAAEKNMYHNKSEYYIRTGKNRRR